jgi:alpha/beta superfamily hydrolase
VNAEGRAYRYELLRESPLPKLMVSGDHDPFATVAQLEEIFAAAAEPKRLVVIPAADHFFSGHLEELREAVRGWVREVLGAGEQG